MKNNKQTYLLFLIQIILLSLFLSCSDESTIEADYTFKAAINVEQSINDFGKVKFQSFDNLNLGFFRGNLWIKLEIKNEEYESKSYMFISNDRFNRNYVFYKLDSVDNSLKLVNHIKDHLKKDYRTFNNPNPNLKIDLAPNEQATYLITTTSDGRSKDATPIIISLENYINFVNENTIWNIVFYGIIFCLLIINIYQWVIYKQKIYFYYIFYILSTCLVYLGIEGYFQLLEIKQIFIDHFIFVFVKMWALSLIIYTTKFLETQIVAPKYYQFIKRVLVVVLGGILLYQFIFFNSSIQYLHYFENVLSFLWLLLIIGAIISSAKTRRLELKYYLIPLTCFIVFTITGLVNVHLQILPVNSFYFVKVGAIIELIGFTYFMTVLIKRKLESVTNLEYELNITSEKLEQKNKLLSAQKGIKKTDLISIFKLVENSLSKETDWDAFKLKFKELSPNFINGLLVSHPDLSKSEIRLLTLIKIGYSQKEIANILNIAPDSVKKAKSRVRKKLNISETVRLNEYLLNF